MKIDFELQRKQMNANKKTERNLNGDLAERWILFIYVKCRKKV